MSELHQSLMEQAYARWQGKGWSKEEFHDSLDAQERFAVHTGNFNYQVENGGFMQWWDNRYGTPSTVDFLLRACERMATETSAEVAVLLKRFKKAVKDKDPRKHIDEEEYEEIADELSGMDTTYYAINEKFMADCEAHLQKGGY